MNIQELEDKHRLIWVEEGESPWKSSNSHTKLSVEFAISVLEELKLKNESSNIHTIVLFDDKIQELKQYLDE